MARNTGRGSRLGAGIGLPPDGPGLWQKQNSPNGRFSLVREQGGRFAGTHPTPHRLRRLIFDLWGRL